MAVQDRDTIHILTPSYSSLSSFSEVSRSAAKLGNDAGGLGMAGDEIGKTCLSLLEVESGKFCFKLVTQFLRVGRS